MSFFKRSKKYLSLGILVVFGFFSLAPIVPPTVYADGSSGDAQFPKEFGTVEKSFKGNSPYPVYYIQDAHSSLEAQGNIAKIVTYLVENRGVKKVFVEGYQGELPLDSLFPIHDPQSKEKVARFFMNYLRLGGAEYAYLTRKQDFKIIGIDQEGDYQADLKAYEAAAKNREAVASDLEAISKNLKILADRLYPKEIQEYLKLKKRFDRKKLSLAEYLFRLMKYYYKNGKVPVLIPYSNLQLILDVLNKPTLAPKEREAIEQKLKAIDSKALFADLGHFENDFRNQYLTQAEARETFGYQRKIELFMKLNLLDVTPEEYQEILSFRSDLATQKIADFLAHNLKKPLVLRKDWEQLLGAAYQFYKLAQKRDQNFQSSLQIDGPTVIVTGGFHTDPLNGFLERNKISYFLILPQMIQEDPEHQARYDYLMSGRYYDFERIFAPRAQAAKQEGLPNLALKGFDVPGMVTFVGEFLDQNGDLSVLNMREVSAKQQKVLGSKALPHRGEALPEVITFKSVRLPLGKAASLGDKNAESTRGPPWNIRVLEHSFPSDKAYIYTEMMKVIEDFAKNIDTPEKMIDALTRISRNVFVIRKISPDLDVSFVGEGAHKLVFKIQVKVEDHGEQKVIPLVIPVIKKEKVNNKGKTKRNIENIEITDLKQLNGQNVPKFGLEFMSDDGRRIYIEEFIRGPTFRELEVKSRDEKKDYVTTEMRKSVIKALLNITAGLGGRFPMDAHGKNFVIEEGTQDMVMVDLGDRRLKVRTTQEPSNLKHQILMAGIMFLHYGYNQPFRNQYIFDAIEEAWGKDEAQNFFRLIYDRALEMRNTPFRDNDQLTRFFFNEGQVMFRPILFKFRDDQEGGNHYRKFADFFLSEIKNYLDGTYPKIPPSPAPVIEGSLPGEIQSGTSSEPEKEEGASLGSKVEDEFNAITTPGLFFVDASEFKNFSSELKFYLAAGKISVVTCNDAKSEFSELEQDYKNFHSFRGNELQAYERFGRTYRGHIVHLSKTVDPSDQLSPKRFYFFRQRGDKPGTVGVALYYQLVDGKLGEFQDEVTQEGGFLVPSLEGELAHMIQDYRSHFAASIMA